MVSVTENELDAFCSILREAAVWLNNQGQEMWRQEQLSADNLLKSYAYSEMYLGYVDGAPASAMVLQEEDRALWPEAGNDSLYIHKLSVRRKFAKSGLSSAMISWAKSQAAERRKKYLRLDCAADREKLCCFYEGQGFCKVDEKLLFGRYPTAFYELEV
jgi:GNAT superfamily N-acetyltransferase